MERTEEMRTGSIVLAIGGNALQPPGETADLAAMHKRIRATAQVVADLVAGDTGLVLTHGNGPQVGNLLLQTEESRGRVPAAPLDVLGAETQAQIGYLLQQALRNEFTKRGRETGVATIVTQVVVDADDPAFHNPTKPIGPTIPTETEAMIKRARGWNLLPDARGGWRRVVPSPRPLEVVELAAIRALLEAGAVVIAAGGGGIPVVRRGTELVGVEAVIDKDLTSVVLARGLAAERLVLATDVERVALDFKKPGQRFLERMTVAEAREYLRQGQFPAGSMGPKVEAAVSFVESGGKEARIANLSGLKDALDGDAGTRIVP